MKINALRAFGPINIHDEILTFHNDDEYLCDGYVNSKLQ